jgi:gentisate 1,2-dioxygenase
LVLSEEQTEWEWNPQGKMRWYLHPGLDDVSVTSFLWATHDIPPGSRSGRQLRQGGVVHYILEGQGHSVVNGERYDWQKDDFLALPIKPDGHDVQHFNDDPANPARFIRAEPYLHNELGYDLGCGFKQLEACPEWQDDASN